MNGKFEIKGYYKKDLADLYEVSLETFRKMIKELYEDKTLKKGYSHRYTPKEVESIVDYLGVPKTVDI